MAATSCRPAPHSGATSRCAEVESGTCALFSVSRLLFSSAHGDNAQYPSTLPPRYCCWAPLSRRDTHAAAHGRHPGWQVERAVMSSLEALIALPHNTMRHNLATLDDLPVTDDLPADAALPQSRNTIHFQKKETPDTERAARAPDMNQPCRAAASLHCTSAQKSLHIPSRPATRAPAPRIKSVTEMRPRLPLR